MTHTAGIGPSIQITGTISAQEPLVVSGRIIGSIEMPGHVLTIMPEATVDGDIDAEGILINGTASGRLRATSHIAVHETAKVEGAVTTPVMSVAIGAVMQADCTVEGRGRAAGSLAG